MFYRKRDQNHLKSSCPESYFLVKLVVGGGGGVGVTLRVWYTLFECVSDGGRGGYVGECLTSFFAVTHISVTTWWIHLDHFHSEFLFF